VYKLAGENKIPLVCVEYKRVFGEGSCDPSVQAAYSVREFLVLDKFKSIFEKCCCPCFLLSGSGAYLSILGVVFPYKFTVQRLTDALWVGEATPHEDGRFHRLAQVFYALRLAVAELETYYNEILEDQEIPELVNNMPHPRFFPHPTKFMEYATKPKERKEFTFKYTNLPRTDATNVTFFAKDLSSGRPLVIKFVERYGVEAHELLASKDMAPRLLYCGLLDGETDVRHGESRVQGSIRAGGLYVGPIRMVVMEYIQGSTLDKTPNPPKDTRGKIEKALKALHDGNLVFGDLRAPNVMISGTKVYLIDFDWSGRVNKACYPLRLSMGLGWPEGAGDLKPILPGHDSFMLDRLFPPPRQTMIPL